MRTIDPRHMARGDVHDLFVSIIVPRPIALISTVGENGVNNIAPYSTLAWCCFKPPLVSIVSASAPDGSKRDTQRNIEFTKDFVINMTTERLVESMIKSATDYPPEVDEFKECGFTAVKGDMVSAPMIAESPINIECQLVKTFQFGEYPFGHTMFIGEVVRVHVLDELWIEGEIKTSEFETRRDAGYKVVANPIDISKLEAIGVLRGRTYCRTTKDTFELALIYGAGTGGQLALKEIETHRDLRLRLVGFIDDKPGLKGQIIQGYPVFGGYEEMEKIIRTYRTTKIIISFKEKATEKMEGIKALCRKMGVEVDVEQSLSSSRL
jgi:flavin reductase (DIM6/NTAB) family NADH-FMN oxidoreductase RutF